MTRLRHRNMNRASVYDVDYPMTGCYGEQKVFQKNEKTVEHSDHSGS